MCITIPQSVQDYFQNLRQQQEVDALMGRLATGNWLPPGIQWSGLREHYNNLLTAATVRTEYAILLIDVWNAVWLPALTERDIINAIQINAMDNNDKPSPAIPGEIFFLRKQGYKFSSEGVFPDS